MPANIPSPVVGAGGQGSRPWFEQMLLTLASQGPQALMGWLEYRQQGQQQQAVDAAAQSSLIAMSGTATPEEQAAMQAGGMQLAPRAAGAASPSGISMPAVQAQSPALQTNARGMQRGVAAPLLQQMREGRQLGVQERTGAAQVRSADASVAASGAQVRAADVNTAETIAGGQRAAQLQPGALTMQGEELQRSQAQRRLAQVEADNAAKMLPYQIKQLQAAITRDEMQTRQAGAELNTLSTSLAGQHRQEYTKVFGDLLGTIGNQVAGAPTSRQAAERLAARIVFGTDSPPTPAELSEFYKQAVETGAPTSLYEVISGRIQQEFKLSPEEYAMRLDALDRAGGDARVALETAKLNGANMQDLMKAAILYSFETGASVKLPVEAQPALLQLLGEAPNMDDVRGGFFGAAPQLPGFSEGRRQRNKAGAGSLEEAHARQQRVDKARGTKEEAAADARQRRVDRARGR